MKFTLGEQCKAVQSVKAQSSAAGTVEGDGVDCKGYDQALVILDCGTVGVNTTLDVKIQESGDDGDADAYADVTGAAFTQVDPDNDDAVYIGRLRTGSRERYLRAYGTIAGDNAALFSVPIVLAEAKYPPQSDQALAFNITE